MTFRQTPRRYAGSEKAVWSEVPHPGVRFFLTERGHEHWTLGSACVLLCCVHGARAQSVVVPSVRLYTNTRFPNTEHVRRAAAQRVTHSYAAHT